MLTDPFTRTAGNLTLTVWHIGPEYSPEDRGERQRYAYSITDRTRGYEGNDIRSGVGAAPDVRDAMATLVSFLSAAAEAYGYSMRGYSSDNATLFPQWIMEAAYQNSDELAMLSETEA
jgi:hypothetical protein